MPRVALVICGQNAVIDKITGSVSIFELIDELTPPGYPAWYPRLAVVALFTRTAGEPEEFETTLSACIGDNVLFRGQSQMNFQGKTSCRQVSLLQGIPLLSPGVLRVSIEGPNIEGGEYLINLVAVATPSTNTPAPEGQGGASIALETCGHPDEH